MVTVSPLALALATEAEAALEDWQPASQDVTVVVVLTVALAAAAFAADSTDLEEWHRASQTVSVEVVKEVTVTALLLPVEQLVTSSVMVSSTYSVALVQPPEQEVIVSISVAITDLVTTVFVLLFTMVEYAVAMLSALE